MAEEKLTNWKNLAKYDYLGAYSLEGVVNELTLTIKSIVRAPVTAEGGATENCIIANFEETNKNGVVVKPMVLNKTNCKMITSLYGTPFIEQWVGKKITIYVQQNVKFGRELKPALRIKNVIPSFKCSVCGKEIDENIYNGSIAKYGAAYCSQECLEKAKQSKN